MNVQHKKIDMTQVKKALDALGKEGPRMAGAAFYREAERIMGDAKGRTPVDTGALRASGHVRQPKIQKGQASVELGFGNSSVGYAIYVHENLGAAHTVGEAKFFENAVNAARGGMVVRLIADLQRQMAAIAGKGK